MKALAGARYRTTNARMQGYRLPFRENPESVQSFTSTDKKTQAQGPK